MPSPKWLRPSSLARLAACPASGIESDGKASAGSDASAAGLAFHEVFEVLVLRGRQEAEIAVADAAMKYGTPREQLQAWLDKTEWSEPDGTWAVLTEEPVEIEVGGVRFSGRTDLILYNADMGHVQINDVKTGDPSYAEDTTFLQLEAYAIGAAQRFEAKSAEAVLYYVRLGTEGWVHRDVDLAEAEVRIAGIVQTALAQVDLEPAHRSYRVGSHCAFCPARPTCPARNAELRSFAALIESEAWQVTTANAPQLLDRARAIERMCGEVRDAVKDTVRAAGGELVADDGRVLRIVTSERRAYEVPAGTTERLVVSKS